MDFGFGSVIEKFEEYFGRPATGFLLACVGLALIGTTLGITYRAIVEPLFEIFLDKDRISDLNWILLMNAVSFLVVFFAAALSRYIGGKYWNADRYRILLRGHGIRLAKVRREAQEAVNQVRAEQEGIETRLIGLNAEREGMETRLIGLNEALLPMLKVLCAPEDRPYTMTDDEKKKFGRLLENMTGPSAQIPTSARKASPQDETGDCDETQTHPDTSTDASD